MKKLFIALSFIAALAFMATPSMALVGSPDPVVATNIVQPFFLVSFDGNLDTLVSLTNTKGANLTYGWTIWDKTSKHRANGIIKFTPHDVISLSLRGLLATVVSSEGLKDLEVDLDGDGVNDHYMGYMTFSSQSVTLDNPATVDPLFGKAYLINLTDGVAAGVNSAGREYTPRAQTFQDWALNHINSKGWMTLQNSFLSDQWLPPVGTLPYPTFTDYEAFTAFAYAASKARENGYNPHDPQGADINLPVPAYFRLTPRFFLLNDSAETYIFLWSSGNWGKWYDDGNFDPDVYSKVVNVYDEDEVGFSTQINIPYELNIIDIKKNIPTSWTAPVGGWMDIAWTFDRYQSPVQNWDYPWYYSAVPLAAEWLAYSWQSAQSADAGLNWAALFDVHRDVGTYVEGGLDLP